MRWKRSQPAKHPVLFANESIKLSGTRMQNNGFKMFNFFAFEQRFQIRRREQTVPESLQRIRRDNDNDNDTST